MLARKTATRIKNGKVQRKNRHTKTPNYWNTRQSEICIDVEDPGKGYKHFLKKRDIIQFTDIFPDRELIEIELDTIVLARYDNGYNRYYQDGVICICAWEKEMTRRMSPEYFDLHKALFDIIDLKYSLKKDSVICYFTENQIKAFQLLRV